MTLNTWDVCLYAFALFVLFLTPGPVWLAVMARAVSGGFRSAWPLAFGVAVGDVVWPLLAILGLSWMTAEYSQVLDVLRWVACAFFLWLGWSVYRNASREISPQDRLVRPGMLAGFIAGVAAILGNPKAVLFYLGVLPGFFDLSAVTAADIAVICVLSVVVPLIGNLCLAWFIDRMRRFVASPTALRRMNLTAAGLLVAVGLALPFA